MFTPAADRPPFHIQKVDIKGKLHRIEDDLDLWVPNMGLIFISEITRRLAVQAAFEDFLRLRAQAREQPQDSVASP